VIGTALPSRIPISFYFYFCFYLFGQAQVVSTFESSQLEGTEKRPLSMPVCLYVSMSVGMTDDTLCQGSVRSCNLIISIIIQ